MSPLPSAGATSISSNAFCPTSAIHRSPVSASNAKRHGLRSPTDQISPSAPSCPTNGLSAGIVYCRSPDGVEGSIRSILPSNVRRGPGRAAPGRRRSRRRPSRCTASRPARTRGRRRCGSCTAARSRSRVRSESRSNTPAGVDGELGDVGVAAPVREVDVRAGRRRGRTPDRAVPARRRTRSRSLMSSTTVVVSPLTWWMVPSCSTTYSAASPSRHARSTGDRRGRRPAVERDRRRPSARRWRGRRRRRRRRPRAASTGGDRRRCAVEQSGVDVTSAMVDLLRADAASVTGSARSGSNLPAQH